MLLISCESEGELMKRKGKRFLVLLTTASLSLNMLGISAFAEKILRRRTLLSFQRSQRTRLIHL